MDSAELSIASITVTYNSGEVIDHHLESLERLVGLDSMAIVDNGSVDTTRARIRAFAEHQELEVRVWEPPDNLGFGAANNLAASKIDTDLLLVVNPDVFIDDNLLLVKARAAFADPSVAVVGCALHREDGTLDHACKRGEPTLLAALAYHLRLEWLGRWFPEAASYRAARIDSAEVADVDAINGAFMLIRRSAFDHVGGFDERFWMYAEDLDLCRMIRSSGGRIVYRGDLRATHLKGASTTGGRTFEAAAAFNQSSVLYYEKWYGPRAWQTRVVAALTWSRLTLARFRQRRRRLAAAHRRPGPVGSAPAELRQL